MPVKVFSVAEMIAAERAADAAGVSYAQMMESAGRSVSDAIRERVGVHGQQVLVLVGPGNNGGDGLVAGRHLAEAGAQVGLYLTRAREAAQDSNLDAVQSMGLDILLAEYDQRLRVLRQRLQSAHIVIDALLGTGVSRPVTGTIADVLKVARAVVDERRSAAGAPRPQLLSIASLPRFITDRNGAPWIVAVDCPSGLNCDTGALDEAAVPAHLTVTFAGPKRGHFSFPGSAACGEIVVADIGIAPDLPAVASVELALATPDLAASLLPERPPDGHKGTFGTVLIAAGSDRYWGAPALTAQGALRAGAGLVALAAPATLRSSLAGQFPEVTYAPVQEADTLGSEAAETTLTACRSAQALLAGPGLGNAGNFLDQLLAGLRDMSPAPALVVDADALNYLAQQPRWWELLPMGAILTPHPGEMARLLGRPLDDVRDRDRVELARERAAAWQHVVVLKGAYTVVAAPDGRCCLMPFANPALAVAGSGDVLAGVIVSLLAQGLPPFEAALLGAYLHGAAGQLAAEQQGDAGLLASEIADYVPAVRRFFSGS